MVRRPRIVLTHLVRPSTRSNNNNGVREMPLPLPRPPHPHPRQVPRDVTTRHRHRRLPRPHSNPFAYKRERNVFSAFVFTFVCELSRSCNLRGGLAFIREDEFIERMAKKWAEQCPPVVL